MGCAASFGMNGESTRRQSVVKVAYIGVLIHSNARNNDRAAGGCWANRQVSSRLGEPILSVTVTESSVTVSPWCDFKFQPRMTYPSIWAVQKSAGITDDVCDTGRRSEEAVRVLKLHVAHPVTRALRGSLPWSGPPATLSPFLTSMMRQQRSDSRWLYSDLR